MATTPRSTESDTVDTPTTPPPHAESTSPHTGTAEARPTRSRWVLPSIVGAGLLSLGLLGGILIGQQLVPPNTHNPGVSSGMSLRQGGPDHVQRVPDGVRERIKEGMKDRIKEMRQERGNRDNVPENNR